MDYDRVSLQPQKKTIAKENTPNILFHFEEQIRALS